MALAADLRVALVQMRPVLGDLDRNLEAHHAWLDRAAAEDAALVVFPELSTSGYFLRDLTQEIATGLDDPRIRRLVERSRERSLLFGLAERSEDHRIFNSAVFCEDGEVLQVHRKVQLPDYGIFEEGRYFAAGDRFVTVRSRLGRFGVLICEDAWHLPNAWLHALQGADALLIPSASPARGVDTEEPELSSHRSWRLLTEALATFLRSWVVHVNRVGFEDGALYWGGSRVCTPFGHAASEAPGDEEALITAALEDESLFRARGFAPLLRDARPEVVRRGLARILEDPDLLRALGEDGEG